jgi:TatD DNase family protein
MSTSFINIHSHHCNGSEYICIRNVIAGKEDIPDSENVFFSYGFHPWFIDNREEVEVQLAQMSNIITRDQCLMIGECGLDKVCETPMDWQEKVFIQQIQISERLNLPMIIHCVKAFEEVLKIRKEMKAKQPWIFHGYGGSQQLAERIVKEGCYLSFGKLIFQSGSKSLATLKSIDPSQFFLETDEADDVTIEDIYKQACRVKGIDMLVLKKRIIENYQMLFS